MPWLVVKFLGTNEVEALPSSWVVDKEKEIAVWPPFHKTMMEKAIRSETIPCADWKEFKVKLLSSRLYDNFLTATSMASKACETSELESVIPLPEKRISKKPSKYVENSSDTESSDDLQPPRPFQSGIESKSGGNAYKKGKDPSKKEGSEIHSGLFAARNVNEDLNNVLQQNFDEMDAQSTSSTNASSHSFDTRNNTNFQKNCIKLLVRNSMLIKECDKKLENLTTIVDDMRVMLSKLSLTKCVDSPAESDDANKIYRMLPMKDYESFDELENQLAKEYVFKHVADYLYHIGGTDYKDCSRRFLKKMVSDSVAANYSLHGHKKKKIFATSKVYLVIVDAIQKCDKSSTLKSIELVIGQWLAKAPERLKKSVLANTTETVTDGVQ